MPERREEEAAEKIEDRAEGEEDATKEGESDFALRGILGIKEGMIQLFRENEELPATLIRVGPCVVVQKKTNETDGYSAVQLGLVEEGVRRKANKPRVGHFRAASIQPTRFVREIRYDEGETLPEVGARVGVERFESGMRVDITATKKGKGFQGVMKRWGFAGGPASHGSRFHRTGGSIMGGAANPSRVFKGKKMPGRMGAARTTVKNLEVVEVDAGRNMLLVKGSVPGPRGGYVVVRVASR